MSWVDIHKGVLQTHHGYDENIHAKGEADDEHIEMDKLLVLGQAVDDKIDPDNVDEVEVETAVDDEVDDLFASVPPTVDPDVPLRYLKAGRYPDAVDRDVDSRDYGCDADFETVRLFLVCEKNRASVDDDLQEELHLGRPVIRG